MQADQQNDNIQNDVAPAKPQGERVIQPSASFVEEIRAAQATPPNPVPPLTKPLDTQNPMQTSQPAATPLIQRSPVNPLPPSSIYPEVTKGIGSVAPVPLQASEPLPGPKLVQGATPKTVAVKVVAGILILLNLVNAYNWVVGSHGGIYNGINLLALVVTLILLVGIYTLKELARSIYVFISAILLALLCIEFFIFFASTYNNASYQVQSKAQPVTKARLESNLKVVENNKGLTPQAKEQEIQQIQKEIKSVPSSPTEARVRQDLSTALFVITSVGPLIFFTRPSIKAVFD